MFPSLVSRERGGEIVGSPRKGIGQGRIHLCYSYDRVRSLGFVRRRVKGLLEHDGCVNTAFWNEDGTRLVTGSDDLHIKVWEYGRMEVDLDPCVHDFRTNHASNIFMAQFMPNHQDTVVSCAADGELRINFLGRSGEDSSSELIGSCAGMMLQFAFFPESWPGYTHTLLTAGSGRISIYDIRVPRSGKLHSVRDMFSPADGKAALTLSRFTELKAVTPFKLSGLPHYAVGGSGPVVQVLDVRKQYGHGAELESNVRVGLSSSKHTPLCCFDAKPYYDREKAHRTTGRRENNVYMPFSSVVIHGRRIYQEEEASSDGSDDDEDEMEQDEHHGDKEDDEEEEDHDDESAQVQNEVDDEEDEEGDDDNGDESLFSIFDFFRMGRDLSVSGIALSQDEREALVSFQGGVIHRFAVPQGMTGCEKVSQLYGGHENEQTFLKTVSYYGPNEEYIISGSDDGYLYFWDRRTSEMVSRCLADTQIVNGAAPNPKTPAIVAYGIDSFAKLLLPTTENAWANSNMLRQAQHLYEKWFFRGGKDIRKMLGPLGDHGMEVSDNEEEQQEQPMNTNSNQGQSSASALSGTTTDLVIPRNWKSFEPLWPAMILTQFCTPKTCILHNEASYRGRRSRERRILRSLNIIEKQDPHQAVVVLGQKRKSHPHVPRAFEAHYPDVPDDALFYLAECLEEKEESLIHPWMSRFLQPEESPKGSPQKKPSVPAATVAKKNDKRRRSTSPKPPRSRPVCKCPSCRFSGNTELQVVHEGLKFTLDQILDFVKSKQEEQQQGIQMNDLEYLLLLMYKVVRYEKYLSKSDEFVKDTEILESKRKQALEALIDICKKWEMDEAICRFRKDLEAIYESSCGILSPSKRF